MSSKEFFIVGNVYGVSRTSLMVGEFRSKALLALLQEETTVDSIPIIRSFKGNRKKFELSGVRVIEGKITQKTI